MPTSMDRDAIQLPEKLSTKTNVVRNAINIVSTSGFGGVTGELRSTKIETDNHSYSPNANRSTENELRVARHG
jgi:hypothetical protein